MTWQIEFGKKARKDFAALDRSVQRNIYNYLFFRVAEANHPKDFGKPLRHSLSGLWCYRVGDYRIVCSVEEANLVVLVVEIGHRSVVCD